MNTHQQIGINKIANYIDTPVLIETLTHQDIIQVIGGQNHSMARTNIGRIYSWGSNENGLTGQYLNINTTNIPTEIMLPSVCTDISCSWNHSIAVLGKYTIYDCISFDYKCISFVVVNFVIR
jgi:alpha-tubulin suppressor-like RCC1 family protein